MFVDDELNDLYVSLIKQYHKECTVLDLGTGTAPLAIKLAKEGYFVTATDISTDMLEMGYNNALNEGVRINFFIHDILDTVNKDYDCICMSSDVINYIIDEEEVIHVFKNVALAMNKDSIFVFDFLRAAYLEKIDGHQEEILLSDDLLTWNVVLTNIEHQIKHTIKIGTDIETHIQRTYLSKDYVKMLKQVGIHVLKKVKLEDRIVFVCKKEM
jgi:SAM-dependent methyltransferase